MMTLEQYLKQWRSWVDTSSHNEYGDKVAAHVIYSVRDKGLRFRCKDEQWGEVFGLWCKLRQRGEEDIPEPCPTGHNMFLYPMSYSCYPEGTTDRLTIRRAYRCMVRADLDGWDRELLKSKEGIRQLAKIVSGTTRARMGDVELGGAPYIACIMAGV